MSEFESPHIVSVTPDVRHPALRYISLSDGRTQGPYLASSIIACSVITGCKFDELLQMCLEHADQLTTAKELAMNYLANARHTEREVRNYLSRKEVLRNVAEEVIEWLRNQQWINDEEIGKYMIQKAKMPGSTQSKKMVASKLMQRGLSVSSVASVMCSENYHELSAAKLLAEKKWRELMRKQVVKPRLKLAAYLSRRGFTSTTIHKVLDDLDYSDQ